MPVQPATVRRSAAPVPPAAGAHRGHARACRTTAAPPRPAVRRPPRASRRPDRAPWQSRDRSRSPEPVRCRHCRCAAVARPHASARRAADDPARAQPRSPWPSPSRPSFGQAAANLCRAPRACRQAAPAFLQVAWTCPHYARTPSPCRHDAAPRRVVGPRAGLHPVRVAALPGRADEGRFRASASVRPRVRCARLRPRGLPGGCRRRRRACPRRRRACRVGSSPLRRRWTADSVCG